MTDLTAKMFHDEDAAREYFEAQRWPDGRSALTAAMRTRRRSASYRASRIALAFTSATLAASISP